MIKEDYVSFETSKLLKEKGFDEPCDFVYDEGKLEWIHHKFIFLDGKISTNSTFNFDGIISAPTIQMAKKWLREVHHYYIQVMLDSWACGGHTGYYVLIQKTDSDFELMLQDVREQVFYETPEEAHEDAIKYCLEKLI